MIVIHLRAPNDSNGNPRRLYLIIDPSNGLPIDCIDEGYLGNSAYKSKYPESVYSTQIDIPAKEYRRIRKQFSELS